MENKENENNNIMKTLERLKKLSAEKKVQKENKTHHQFNLQIEDDTPETTIKRERNSSPRNKIQKVRKDSLNISPSAEESIANIKSQIEKSRIEREQIEQQKNEERIENKKNKIKRRLKK